MNKVLPLLAVIDGNVADNVTSIGENQTAIGENQTAIGENVTAIEGIITVIEGMGFVSRGDPSSYDRDKDDFSIDNAWHSWDISGIIGENAALVILGIQLNNSSVLAAVQFRENGNSQSVNVRKQKLQETNKAEVHSLIVEADAAGVIEYKFDNVGTWAYLNVAVLGWLLI